MRWLKYILILGVILGFVWVHSSLSRASYTEGNPHWFWMIFWRANGVAMDHSKSEFVVAYPANATSGPTNEIAATYSSTMEAWGFASPTTQLIDIWATGATSATLLLADYMMYGKTITPHVFDPDSLANYGFIDATRGTASWNTTKRINAWASGATATAVRINAWATTQTADVALFKQIATEETATIARIQTWATNNTATLTTASWATARINSWATNASATAITAYTIANNLNAWGTVSTGRVARIQTWATGASASWTTMDAMIYNNNATLSTASISTAYFDSLDITPQGYDGLANRVVEIVPQEALLTTEEMVGLYVSGANLDPTGPDTRIAGIEIALDGLGGNMVGDLAGLHITMPSGSETHAIHISGGAPNIRVDYTANDQSGAEYTIHDIILDVDDLATTSAIHAMDVAIAEGVPLGRVTAIAAHSYVDPIHQEIGTFTTPSQTEYAGRYTSSWTDGIDTHEIFVAKNNYICIGAAAVFSEIEVDMSTVATKSVSPTFWYSTGASSWTQFFPADDTDGFRQDGLVRWEAADIPGWTGDGDPGGAQTTAGYYIKITRAANPDPGTPTVTTMKAGTVIEYSWNKDGVINPLGLLAARATITTATITSASISTIYNDVLEAAFEVSQNLNAWATNASATASTAYEVSENLNSWATLSTASFTSIIAVIDALDAWATHATATAVRINGWATNCTATLTTASYATARINAWATNATSSISTALTGGVSTTMSTRINNWATNATVTANTAYLTSLNLNAWATANTASSTTTFSTILAMISGVDSWASSSSVSTTAINDWATQTVVAIAHINDWATRATSSISTTITASFTTLDGMIINSNATLNTASITSIYTASIRYASPTHAWLHPEYGITATMSTTAGNHNGTMQTLEMAATDGTTYFNTYRWTSASATDNVYYVLPKWTLPKDWHAWDDQSTAVTVYCYTGITGAANNGVHVDLFKNGVATALASAATQATASWHTIDFTSASMGTAWTQGNVVRMVIRLAANSTANSEARLGPIRFSYK